MRTHPPAPPPRPTTYGPQNWVVGWGGGVGGGMSLAQRDLVVDIVRAASARQVVGRVRQPLEDRADRLRAADALGGLVAGALIWGRIRGPGQHQTG